MPKWIRVWVTENPTSSCPRWCTALPQDWLWNIPNAHASWPSIGSIRTTWASPIPHCWKCAWTMANGKPCRNTKLRTRIPMRTTKSSPKISNGGLTRTGCATSTWTGTCVLRTKYSSRWWQPRENRASSTVPWKSAIHRSSIRNSMPSVKMKNRPFLQACFPITIQRSYRSIQWSACWATNSPSGPSLGTKGTTNKPSRNRKPQTSW